MPAVDRPPVTAEVASSSLVVPAILSKRLNSTFERMAWYTKRCTLSDAFCGHRLFPFQNSFPSYDFRGKNAPNSNSAVDYMTRSCGITVTFPKQAKGSDHFRNMELPQGRDENACRCRPPNEPTKRHRSHQHSPCERRVEGRHSPCRFHDRSSLTLGPAEPSLFCNLLSGSRHTNKRLEAD
jgi:hypothetical protein